MNKQKQEHIIKRYLWWCDDCAAQGSEEALKEARKRLRTHRKQCPYIVFCKSKEI